MLTFLSPGQGAQTPGILAPWLADEASLPRLRELAEAAEFDLRAAGTQWDANQIRDTRIAQPLIFGASLLAADCAARAGFAARVASGHSIGEWTAAVVAGVLTPADAISLVTVRGNAMADACHTAETGLAAILGGDQDTILTRLDELRLAPANLNGAGQSVVGGSREALQALADDPPAGSRVRLLDVAGAFHTDAMAPAVDVVRARAELVETQDPTIPFISNLDGDVVTSGREILFRMVDQIALPVQWDLCMATMERLRIDSAVETCPAGTLAGLLRRGLPGTKVFKLNSPADVLVASSEIADVRSESVPVNA